jgi:EmrB/QacA subfamily drug resistance transporter
LAAVTENVIQQNRYKFFTVGAIGTFMGTLNGSILNVALPTIADDLLCTVDVVAWVALAYTLTLVSLLLVFGAWTERKGYEFAYKFGFSFFILGSLLCIISWSIYSLIIGRIVQAIGASMFQAVGTGMVTEVFPERERGKGIGMMVMMVSAGLMTGPPLGGFLLEFFPWQAIFVLNLPIGLFGIALTFRYFKLLPARTTQRKMRLAGGIAISVALFSGVFGLSLISNYGLADMRVWGLALVSLVSLSAFARFEAKRETALIGLDIFKNRQFTSALVAAISMYAAQAGVLILMPFYLERVKHFEPKTVGLYLIILPVLMFVLASPSGRLSDKIGTRLLTSFGLTILACGLYLLLYLGIDTADSYIILSLVVVGCGVAVFNAPNSSAMMGAVSEGQRAITSGILSASRNIGMSTGFALGTALFAYFQTRYADLGNDSLVFVASYHQVIYTAIAIAVLGIPFCLIRKR